MAGIYIFDMFLPGFNLIARMELIVPLVFRGQLWRIFTFALIPPSGGNIITVAITLYFYYFIGTALESRWGARRFLLFYLIGYLAALVAGFITGIGMNMYLNLSLFFAFAIQYPDYQLLLFFAIPVKVKWLALLNAIFFLFGLFTGNWPVRLAILMSLVHIILFFGGDLFNHINGSIQQWKRRQMFKKNSK